MEWPNGLLKMQLGIVNTDDQYMESSDYQATHRTYHKQFKTCLANNVVQWGIFVKREDMSLLPLNYLVYWRKLDNLTKSILISTYFLLVLHIDDLKLIFTLMKYG